MSTFYNPDTGLQIGHQLGITKNFSMKVEDVFQVPRFGLVATGRVLSGSFDLNIDDTVILCNHGRSIESRVKGIEMGKKLFSYCEWGDKVGLLLPFDDEYYVHPGTLICSTDFPESVRGKYEYSTLMDNEKKIADLPYHDRQFIFLVKDEDMIGSAYDPTGNINFIFSCDNCPADLAFPFGHPQPNTLYYAHPLRPYYMPLEDAGITLFYERIQEMSRLMQCLGAETITLRCVKGNSISEGRRNAKHISLGGGYMSYHADGGFQSADESQSYQMKENEMSEVRHFNPTCSPYCPDDLIWAAVDPDLNSLVKQRLEGGLMTFSKRVSTKESMNVSASRLKDIQAAFKAMMASVSVNYSAESDVSFSETNETLWEINVEFKPIYELGISASSRGSQHRDTAQRTVADLRTHNELEKDKKDDAVYSVVDSSLSASPSHTSYDYSENEKTYLEEYRQCLADEDISSAEIRLLKKLAMSLGISEERAKELEASCKFVQLTDVEKQYLEEYKACIEDDAQISASTRRLLNRLASSLNLTEDQISRLEKM